MLLECGLGEDTNVIEKIENTFSEQVSQHSVHGLLICCESIAQSEGHDEVLENTFLRDECCLDLVVRMYSDLPVSRDTIES